MRIRRNADADMRRHERVMSSGDAEAQAAYIYAQLRAGSLEPERISMAAYLGHPGAMALDLPPPPNVERRESITRGPLAGFAEGSLAQAILDGAAISTKHATLFGSDCAVRLLTRVYGSTGQEVPSREAFNLAVAVLEAARGWVLGHGHGDPVALADELEDLTRSRRSLSLSTDGNVLQACVRVGLGSRSQTSTTTGIGGQGGVVRQAARAIRQSLYGDGNTWRDVDDQRAYRAGVSVYDEKQWQDAHLAHGLLSPRWPLLPLPSYDHMNLD